MNATFEDLFCGAFLVDFAAGTSTLLLDAGVDVGTVRRLRSLLAFVVDLVPYGLRSLSGVVDASARVRDASEMDVGCKLLPRVDGCVFRNAAVISPSIFSVFCMLRPLELLASFVSTVLDLLLQPLVEPQVAARLLFFEP